MAQDSTFYVSSFNSTSQTSGQLKCVYDELKHHMFQDLRFKNPLEPEIRIQLEVGNISRYSFNEAVSVSKPLNLNVLIY